MHLIAHIDSALLWLFYQKTNCFCKQALGLSDCSLQGSPGPTSNIPSTFKTQFTGLLTLDLYLLPCFYDSINQVLPSYETHLPKYQQLIKF